MDKIAVASEQDRRDLFQETANRKGLAPLIIEKDFWEKATRSAYDHLGLSYLYREPAPTLF